MVSHKGRFVVGTLDEVGRYTTAVSETGESSQYITSYVWEAAGGAIFGGSATISSAYDTSTSGGVFGGTSAVSFTRNVGTPIGMIGGGMASQAGSTFTELLLTELTFVDTTPTLVFEVTV